MAGVPGEACSGPSGRSGEPFGAPGPGARQTARGVPRTSVRAAREGLPAIGRSACSSRGRRRPHLHSRFTPAAGGGSEGACRRSLVTADIGRSEPLSWRDGRCAGRGLQRAVRPLRRAIRRTGTRSPADRAWRAPHVCAGRPRGTAGDRPQRLQLARATTPASALAVHASGRWRRCRLRPSRARAASKATGRDRAAAQPRAAMGLDAPEPRLWCRKKGKKRREAPASPEPPRLARQRLLRARSACWSRWRRM